MKSRNIMVIGSSGYIGSYLCNTLSEKYSILGVDSSAPKNIPKHGYIIKDYAMLYQHDLANIDAVILLAGNSSVGSCEGHFHKTFVNNVMNFENLLHLISTTNPRIKIIYASSASVYGRGNLNAVETDPLDIPLSNYDASKQMIDDIALRYMSQLEIYGLRFGTVCGHSPNMRWELMLNSMYKAASNGEAINVTNPRLCRSVLDIKDLGTAVCKILDSETNYAGIYNLASIHKVILGYACFVRDETNAKLVVYGPDSTNGYNFLINCDKFSNIFDWTPQGNVKTIIDDLKENTKNEL